MPVYKSISSCLLIFCFTSQNPKVYRDGSRKITEDSPPATEQRFLSCKCVAYYFMLDKGVSVMHRTSV